MVSGRIYQATIALLLVLSVSVVGAAVTYSRGNAAARIQRAVHQVEAENALPAPAEGGRTIPNEGSPAVALPADTVTPEESGALDRQLRSFRVRLSADNTLSGQVNVFDPSSGSVMAMNDIRVVFLQNGVIKARTEPAADGVFKVALEPGMYAIVASGPRGYAAYGLQAVRPETAVVHTAAFQEIRDTLQINTLAIPSRDFQTAKRLARTYIPRELLEKSNDAGGAPVESGEPVAVNGAEPETALSGQSVSIRDGVLLGRMRRLHPQTGQPVKVRRLNAFLVHNNAVLAQAAVNEAGFFKFKNVDPGVYSFVAAGADGLAAFSFQAVNSSVASKDTPNELTLVSFADGDGASGSTTGSENAGAATDAIGDGGGDGDGDGTGAGEGAGEGGAGEGGSGGGTGGGTGGGGGGVGGGGDGLLGLVGLGLGAAALGIALDDDDNNPPSPQTPDM